MVFPRIFICSLVVAAGFIGVADARADSVALPPAIGGFDYKACLPQLSNTGVQSGDGIPYVNSYVASGQPSNMTMGGQPGNYFCLVGAPLHYNNVSFGVEVYHWNGDGTLGPQIGHFDATISALLPKYIIEGPSSGQAGEPFRTTAPIYTDPGSDLGWTSTLVGGNLPAGLTLSGNGVISGTPTESGTFNFTLEYTTPAVPWQNSARPRNSFSLTFAAAAPPLTLGAPATTNAIAYQPFADTLSPANGTAPFTYAVSAGTLPPGVTLGPQGALSGTPTKAGQYSFTVTVTDAKGKTASKAYSVTVAWPQLDLAPAVLPRATIGKRYSARLAASKGAAPYNYALRAGSRLPKGLTLSRNGVISGTPTGVLKKAKTYRLLITFTDVNGAPGEDVVLLTLKPAPKKAVKKAVSRRG
jgi:hypothetical protein